MPEDEALKDRRRSEGVVRRRSFRRRSFRRPGVLALVLLPLLQVAAYAKADPPGRDPLSVDPKSWMVEAAKYEKEMLVHPNSYIRYHTHVQEAKGNFVRDVIESRDGTVARTIMKDGRTLTAEEDQAERERLTAMINDPDAFARHERKDIPGKKNAEAIVDTMPGAMIWSYAAGQPQVNGNNWGQQVVIDFKPDPNFKPPSLESQGLTGMTGRIWIEIKSHHIVHLEARVSQPISIGFGMLVRVYPGGTLSLDQVNVGGPRWLFKHFTEQLNVRALLVKQMNIKSEVETADFEFIPGMSYQDAVRMLLNTPLTQKTSFSPGN